MKKSVNLTMFFLIICIIIIAGMGYYIYKLNGKLEEKIIEKEQIEIENKEEIKEDNEIVVNEKFNISYENEEYITYDKEKNIVSKSKRNLPIISSKTNKEAARKIQESLKNISDLEWNGNIKQMADEMTENGFPTEENEEYIIGVNYLIKTVLQNEKYVSFEIDMEGGFGGVSWIANDLYNYDAETGDLLKFDDVFKNSESLKNTILEKTKQYIKENDVIVFDEVKDTDILRLMSSDGNWGFTENGLKINYPKYSISNGATGIITIELSKKEIEKIETAE